ncbi:hypothetical protein HY485_01515, partial [Candidatus Woesearchaeota archaeon]|nr:hypothetical protein [Candidatus Woesearchaeota archaeon]
MTIADKLYRKVIIFVIVVLIITPIVYSVLFELLVVADAVGQFFKEKEPRLPWHAVEDWEVNVCQKWGGRTQAEQGET